MERATPLRPTDQRAPELSAGAFELQQCLEDSERTFHGAIDSLNGLNAQPDPSTELDEVRCSETLRELLALKVKAQKLAITAKAHQIATAPALVSDAPASASLDGKQKTETQILIESAIGENSKRMLIMARVMSDKDGYFGNLHKEVIVQASDLPVSTAEDRIEDPMERTEAIAKALVAANGDPNMNEQVRGAYRLSVETLKLIIDNIALFSDAATARAIEAKMLLDAERERELAEAEAAAAQQTDGPEEVSLDQETIQEVTDAIEGRIQSYRDQATEVLGRKRTGVVDALNATLGMQSVINELKVKGMKHGVSPDLISIPLASLTSGEINENILLQMQERMRDIAAEISQCTKEIALSDPSKWEHSVHKYNTAEAWKARFGKAKPIEAAAQATGLLDSAERRSREAREEVRLALSAVAEFGEGPEQVGPEDAMERLQDSPVLLARIRHVHEDAQKRKGELEHQRKELDIMLVYVEKCVERAKELERALDGYDRRLASLTNENSPTGPLLLRLQELESAQAEDWDLDAMIEVCGRLRDMHHDAGETHDEELMEQRIQIIEGLRTERIRAQSAAPPSPPDDAPVAAAGAAGSPPERGGNGPPTPEATPRVERTRKSYEHTMAITLPVKDTIKETFTGLVVDGKQAVIRVELIPNGTERVWREDESKEGGGEWVDESRFTPAISVIFDEDDERQKLLLDGLIAKGTQTSANLMTVYTGSQDTFRWGVRRLNGEDGEALTGSELNLQIWCDIDTVRQENIVRIGDDIAQTKGGKADITEEEMDIEFFNPETLPLDGKPYLVVAKTNSSRVKVGDTGVTLKTEVTEDNSVLLQFYDSTGDAKLSVKESDNITNLTEPEYSPRVRVPLDTSKPELFSYEVTVKPDGVNRRPDGSLVVTYQITLYPPEQAREMQSYFDALAEAGVLQEGVRGPSTNTSAGLVRDDGGHDSGRPQAPNAEHGYVEQSSLDSRQRYETAAARAAQMTAETPVDELDELIATFRQLQDQNRYPDVDQHLDEDCDWYIDYLGKLRGSGDDVNEVVPSVDVSHIPAPIKLQLDRLVNRIPDSHGLRTRFAPAIYNLYNLEGVIVEGELRLVEKASEIAADSKIPIVQHAVPAFAEFIQAVFTRDSETGLVSSESQVRVREHFKRMITEDVAAGVDLVTVLAGGTEGLLLRTTLTTEGDGALDKSGIAQLVVKLIAKKMGENADSSPVVESLGKVTEGLCNDATAWKRLGDILQETEGFDRLVDKLKEHFTGEATA